MDSTVALIIKVAVFIASVLIICWTFFYQKIDSVNLLLSYQYIEETNLFLLLPVLILLPLNWFLEVNKWRFLISPIERLDYQKASEGVLTGITLGFITPNGIGDIAGRILQLSGKERVRGIGAIFMNKISQFYITLFFGSVSFLFFVSNWFSFQYQIIPFILIFFILITNLLFIFPLYNVKAFYYWIKNTSYLKKFSKYFAILKQYEKQDISYVLLLSLVRYLVFTAQYILMLYFFKVELPLFILLIGVFFIFLAKSVIPTLFELGVRETAAVIFFGYFGVSAQNVLLASISIWIINLLIPSLTGLLFIFRIKLISRR